MALASCRLRLALSLNRFANALPRLRQMLRICLGAIAQLGERVLCKHEVVGSIPSGSTRRLIADTLPRREAPQGRPAAAPDGA